MRNEQLSNELSEKLQQQKTIEREVSPFESCIQWTNILHPQVQTNRQLCEALKSKLKQLDEHLQVAESVKSELLAQHTSHNQAVKDLKHEITSLTGVVLLRTARYSHTATAQHKSKIKEIEAIAHLHLEEKTEKIKNITLDRDQALSQLNSANASAARLESLLNLRTHLDSFFDRNSRFDSRGAQFHEGSSS